MKNKEKTVSEWLQYAKEQGYEWADAAIENCENHNLKPVIPGLKYAIIIAFDWASSPESWKYWSDIYDIL